MAVAALLFSVAAVVSSCSTGTPVAQKSTEHDNPSKVARSQRDSDKGHTKIAKTSKPGSGKPSSARKGGNKAGSEKTVHGGVKVKAVLPKEVLSKRGLSKKPPRFEKWDKKGSADSSRKMISTGTSAGAIPAVAPFNFGRDPGGPDDKTLYLTIPRLGINGVPVYNSTDPGKLDESAVHIPATGFPWQKGANVYIAGHRLGYPNTGSLYLFYHLPELASGDEIILEDSAGGKYFYRVVDQKRVNPDNVQVMNPVPGKSLVSLQTCTLPNYTRRIVVQGKLVKKDI